jgi:SAM-dependent methyltransferase
VRAADITELDGAWAAIVFWHSLEHLRNPGQAVAHAASLLKPGGLLVIAVPNAASVQASVFADRWLALDPPRHLVHLPAAALLGQLRSHSLTVERVSYWRGGQVVFGWLHGFVGRLLGGLDLYDAIRRPDARSRPQTPRQRVLALVAGTLLTPFALVASAIEVALRRGGTVYVEARRG